MRAAPFLILFFLAFPFLNASINPRRNKIEFDSFISNLNEWDEIIKRSDFIEGLDRMELIINEVEAKLDLVQDRNALKSIYSLAIKSFNKFADSGENKMIFLKLEGLIIGFGRAFYREKAYTLEQIFTFINLAIERIVLDGSYDENTAKPILQFDFKNSGLSYKLVRTIIGYLSDESRLVNLDDYVRILLHFMKSLKDKSAFDSVMAMKPELANKILALIERNTSSFIEVNFLDWKDIFFPKYMKFNESGLKLYFKLAKTVLLTTQDINFLIQIYSCVDNFDLELIDAALNVLVEISDNFNEDFVSVLGTFSQTVRDKVNSKLFEVQKVKFQAIAPIQAKLLSQKFLNDFASDSPSDVFDNLRITLREMAKMNFNLLNFEVRAAFENVLNVKFLGLLEEFRNDFNEEKLMILNLFVPVYINFEELSPQVYEGALFVVEQYSDRLERVFASQLYSQEIQFKDISKILDDFHGEIFSKSEDLLLNLIKFSKYWKMSKITLKSFISYANTRGWFPEEVVICNVIRRTLELRIDPENFDSDELHNLEETVFYIYNDLGFISKSQMVCLYLLLKRSEDFNFSA